VRRFSARAAFSLLLMISHESLMSRAHTSFHVAHACDMHALRCLMLPMPMQQPHASFRCCRRVAAAIAMLMPP